MEDAQIVELYLTRQEQAIQETAGKFGSRLRELSYSIVEDRQTAQECENDTYLQAWNAIPPHDPRDYFFAFLARITRHISLDCCRKRSRIKRSAHVIQLSQELEACIPDPSDVECRMDGVLLGQVISAYLRRLSQEQRNIFLRRYWYMDSIAEISKRFAVSESKVKTTLFRCRGGLKEYLIKEGYSL